ncbi:MBL fold metallo-hydrolase [Hymenobacter saemangeumensis]
MPFTRTFHPVGQGAFYTEQHHEQGQALTVVYDCGSLTGPKSQFLRKVATALPADTVIDVLFISHFHADHINGIDELKKRYTIRAVVLPKLTDEARILVKLENYLEYGGFSTTLIDNPRQYFGKDTLVILVEPVGGDADTPAGAVTEGDNGPFIDISPEEGPSIPPDFRTSKQDASASVPSGTVLRFRTKSRPFWEYIPFNYENSVRGRAFVAELAGMGISLHSLDNIADVIARKPELIKAYKKLKGDLNENSLVVYSGAIGPGKKLCHQSPAYSFPYPCFLESRGEGCLYLGDIDLSIGSVVPDIRFRLQHKWQRIYSIQVPHHGAIGNFDATVFNRGAQAIISFGTTNRYGHPSAHVISQLYRVAATPVYVTEKLETGFYSLD